MNYLPKYAPLNKAVRNGEWESVSRFIEDQPGAKSARITIEGKTPLHVAVMFGHLRIVKGLLEKMSPEEVELPDFNGLTVLHEATYGGKMEVVKCIVQKSPKLVTTTKGIGSWSIPLRRALSYGHTELAQYLYSVTPKEALTYDKGFGIIGATVLNTCYYSQMLGIDIRIEPTSAKEYISINMPETSTRQSVNSIANSGRKNTIYQIKLAHMQTLELLRIACGVLSELKDEELRNSKVELATVEAAEKGIPEFVTEVLKVHVHILWKCEGSRTPFLCAVQFRQARVFSLIHGVIWKEALVTGKDYRRNSLLHMAGMLAPSARLHHISGAALHMQSELIWFKEVESIMPPLKKESLNTDQKTAQVLFTENHKELVKEGEKWMKDTAGSCSLVAALVATIVFAVAFTIPGGNNQNTGYPIFSEKKKFVIFILADAVSLFSSSTSILMFLSILTSRYSEEDFLKALPTKLIIGLSTLFISMATMLIAFCAALFIMVPGKAWVSIPVILLASVPVTLFILLQFPLLVEITMSTYGPSIFDRNVEQWLS